MKAIPIAINWHPGLSIFARESFLKAVGDEYGWLGGFDQSGKLCCLLPYTVITKFLIRMVRFRVETISLTEEFTVDDEKAFLNSAIEYFRSRGAGLIIPATTNTIFRIYPDGAVAAPYSSYVIDLNLDESILWSRLSDTYRKNIRKAIKVGVRIESGIEQVDIVYKLITDTFKRSSLPFMDYKAFKRYILGLGEYVKILVAYHESNPQSCTVFPFSNYCAYAVFGGNISKPITGAMKLIQWEAILEFRKIGVKKFDLVGGRINPTKGTKAEGIVSFKQHFGSDLVEGYMWKYSLNSLKYHLYCLAVHLRSGGDIVDAEHHKLINTIS
jgi:lipid II:glycine glycyltransferase (peptidoglycan interpeptide bridge formation enzyme)